MSSKEAELLKEAAQAQAQALNVKRAGPVMTTETLEEAALDRRQQGD